MCHAPCVCLGPEELLDFELKQGGLVARLLAAAVCLPVVFVLNHRVSGKSRRQSHRRRRARVSITDQLGALPLLLLSLSLSLSSFSLSLSLA